MNPPQHLLYLWQHQKMDSYWIRFIVNVINECHNNSRVWKEGSKKNIFLWKCLWPCGTLKFQIEFWVLMPTSTNNEIEQNKTKNEFVLQTMSSPFNFFLVQTNWFSVWNDSKMMPCKLNHHLICLDPGPLFKSLAPI